MKRKLFLTAVTAFSIATLIAASSPSKSNAQGNAVPTRIEITPHSTNPIIPKGAEGEWDHGFTYGPQVIEQDGLYHMFYAGGEDFSIKPSVLGYATSPDGVTWTKYENNPILQLDLTKYANGIRMAVPLVEDDGTWVLYINPHERQDVADQSFSILRATAPAPTGPWTLDEQPILVAEGGRNWDGHLIAANAIVKADGEYTLFYDAFGSFGAIGRATSSDGLTWTKFDNPDTSRQFANSDPVFVGGEPGTWDDGDNIDPAAVHKTEHGWEMFYTGWGSDWFSYFGGGANCDKVTAGIGFAYSADGITWARFGDAPLITCNDMMVPQISSFVVIDDTYYLYYSLFNTYPASSEIGLATGHITWE